MTEETPGFEEEPDVPSGATPDDAAPKAAEPDSAKEPGPAAPRPGTYSKTPHRPR